MGHSTKAGVVLEPYLCLFRCAWFRHVKMLLFTGGSRTFFIFAVFLAMAVAGAWAGGRPDPKPGNCPTDYYDSGPDHGDNCFANYQCLRDNKCCLVRTSSNNRRRCVPPQ